jgi:hypothetical protein
MPPPGIHQKGLAIRRYRQAQMVGDGFVPVVVRRQSKCRRKVDTQLPFVGFMRRDGLEGCDIAHLGLL